MMRMLRSRQVVASVLVTLVTAAVIGVVLVAITPIGCGPAHALGLKSITNRCLKSGPVANRTTPSPTGSYYVTPGATSSPYYPPVSAPQPPYDPGASAVPTPPYDPSLSAATPPYPPFTPPSSDSEGNLVPPVALNCRLPVYVGPPGSGGFVVFPGGTFIADPRSGVTLPSPSPGGPSPAPAGPGYGPGYSGLSWDRAYSKWLPVPWAYVTPDGSRYAYASSNSIYVQNVADGTEVELGEGKAWSIVGVQAEGVYGTNPNVAGLWLLPYSSPPRQITASGYWQAEAAGAAYGTLSSAVPQGISNPIVRLELKTGAITNWFDRPGTGISVVGFDRSGNPVIYVNYFQTASTEVWIATGPNSGRPLFGSSSGVWVNGPPIADSHGVWFSVQLANVVGGVNLLFDGSGVYVMAKVGALLGGGCN